MAKVTLQPVEDERQLIALRNLMQLYLYDFSVYWDESDPDAHVNERGLFDPGLDLRRYLGRAGRWAYLARLGERLAGFVLLRGDVVHREGTGRSVEDFFVLRRYRRRGVGRSMAFQTFDTYRGYWEVSEIGQNTPAQAFWRRVIGAYTGGRYREFTTAEENGLTIVWQTFDSSAW